MSEDIHRRDFEQLTQSLRDLNTTIKDLRSEMSSTYARKDVIEPRVAEVEKDVARHAEYWNWVARLVIGGVILALLALVLANGGTL